MRRRTFFGLAAGFRAWARGGASSLNRGIAYLLGRQGADGGWHSETYGLLRSGQSLTPLVLNALLDAGVKNKPGIQFIEKQVNADGALGLSNGTVADYPCYASALALRALVRTCGRRHSLVDPMTGWLANQQMVEVNWWKLEDAAYGAWGIGGARRMAPDPGHIDISMTRHVLEALAQADPEDHHGARRKARVFLRRCQNSDSSFFFSTTETGANKAGEQDKGFAGYGTATADGILGLLATGLPVSDPEVMSSISWLAENDDPELPAGFRSDARQRYAEGLRYYYVDGATRALRANRSPKFIGALTRDQRPDGSWANPETLVKEDDPLIATSFAVSALALTSSLFPR